MIYFLLFLMAVIVGIVVILVNQAKKNKKIRQEALDQGAYDGVVCHHIEGLGIGNVPCKILAFDDTIQIESTVNNQLFKIPTERVRAFVTKSEQEFEELDRSVVGRAVIGTLLVPGLGTIIGGMSGLKSKKKKKQKSFYLIINYVDTSGELKGVTFQDDLNIIRLTSFTNVVNTRLSTNSYGQVVEL